MQVVLSLSDRKIEFIVEAHAHVFFQAIYTLDTELQSQRHDMVCPSSN